MKRMFIAATAALCLAAPAAFAEPLSLNFVTGSTSGVYYPLGEAIAQVVNQKTAGTATPLSLRIQSSGASKDNCDLVDHNRAQLALAQNDTADAAYAGKTPFTSKHPNLRAVARIYPEYLHVIAKASGGVGALKDFEGKRVGVGTRGGGNESTSREIFKRLGLQYGLSKQTSNITPIFLPYAETAEQFKAGKIDGFIFTVGTPNKPLQDLMAAGGARFVPIEGAEADRITATLPYLVRDAIPAGTYPGQTAAVPTLAVQAILVANADLPEDAVYLLTKTLFENLRDVAKVYPKGAEIALSRAAQGVTIPFHPGAERYLKERGVLK